jgi:hypothetical protein
MVYKVAANVGRGIKTLTSAVRVSDSNFVYRAALRQACGSLKDVDAKTALQAEIKNHKRGGAHALKTLKLTRAEFQYDRAYRLLKSVLSNEEVGPMPTHSAYLFEREWQLGRAPLREAFEHLKLLEPRLHDIEINSLSVARQSVTESVTQRQAVRRRLNALLGPISQHPDAIVRSQLALSVASQYLAILTGDTELGDLDTPYFEAPVRTVVRAGTGIML